MRTRSLSIIIFLVCFIITGIPIVAQNTMQTQEPSERPEEVDDSRFSNQQSDDSTDEEPQSKSGIDLGIIMGVDIIDYLTEEGQNAIYQSVGIKPVIKIGSFGLSLDLTLRYRFLFNDESFVELKMDDWIPEADSDVTLLDLYLPKIDFIQIGYPGEGLFLKAGELKETTLGTGFIMNRYSNNLYRRNEKILGLNFDLDGKTFNFPIFGLEAVIGNLSRFDVMGARLYLRPFGGTDVPVINEIEIGGSAAVDMRPDIRSEYYTTDTNGGAKADPVMMYNGDLIIPLLNFDMISLALSGNFCYQNSHLGWNGGIGGKLFSILPFNFQVNMYGSNFIPSYFDNTYDLNRGIKYDIYSITDDTEVIEAGQSVTIGTGLVLFDQKFIIDITVDGPLAPPPSDEVVESLDNLTYLDFYHLHGGIKLANGLISNLSFSLTYDKTYINDIDDLFITDNSVLDLLLSYATGSASINLQYRFVYAEDDDPSEITRDDYDISTSIYCTFNLF